MIKRSRKPIQRRKAIRKKTTARKLKQALDLKVRAEIFERDDQRCVRCNSDRQLTASHVYPKGKYPRMRFMSINLLTMCVGCHLFWWHKDPIAAAEWFLKMYPERAEQLRLLKDTAPKVELRG